ncbi:MAG: hypothetical protein ACR2OC_04005 [Solirubrobacterales bacterium]
MLRLDRDGRAPAALVAVALVGFLIALFGTYWDDAWHTEKGRDSFLVAPHIALYLGISLAGGALALWAALVVWARGLGALRSHPPLLLALVGMAVALGAAPLDNAWHLAFGRDAVVWSPPHMLGVAGNLAIAAALLLELSDRPGRWQSGAALIAGAAVLAVGAVPVLEYETDVPQFDLAFYLPVLIAGTSFALGLVRRALRRDWAATEVALVYTAILASISLALELGGMPGPLVPLIVAPALAVDFAARRGSGLLLSAFVVTAATYLAYVPYLNWLRGDIFLDAQAILVGLPLALLGALCGLGLAWLSRSGPKPRSPLAATAVLGLSLLLVGSASAHDPGQGEEVTSADLTATSDGTRASLRVEPAEHCDDLKPIRIVARRAGETLAGPLEQTAGCEFAGQLTLGDRGRWFVYAEFDHQGNRTETWLPIDSGRDEVREEADRSLYVPPQVESSGVKVAAGIAMYGVLLAIGIAIPLLFRRREGDGPLPTPAE